MSDEEKIRLAFEKLAERNHELNLENARLRKILALALQALWQPERVCILGDPIAKELWTDVHRN